jgi:hypothetical protein
LNFLSESCLEIFYFKNPSRLSRSCVGLAQPVTVPDRGRCWPEGSLASHFPSALPGPGCRPGPPAPGRRAAGRPSRHHPSDSSHGGEPCNACGETCLRAAPPIRVHTASQPRAPLAPAGGARGHDGGGGARGRSVPVGASKSPPPGGGGRRAGQPCPSESNRQLSVGGG